MPPNRPHDSDSDRPHWMDRFGIILANFAVDVAHCRPETLTQVHPEALGLMLGEVRHEQGPTPRAGASLSNLCN